MLDLHVTQDVQNTWQLFGKFLSFKAEGVSFQEQCDEFHAFLTDCKTAGGYRAGKANTSSESMVIWLLFVWLKV